MPTITDKDELHKIVSGNGLCTGGESGTMGPIVRAVEYTNIAGECVWGVVYESEAWDGLWNKYMVTSEYLQDPKEVWRHPEIVVLPSGYRAALYGGRYVR